MESIKDFVTMIISDCGCSAYNDRLVDRISARISDFIVSAEKAAYLAGVHSIETAERGTSANSEALISRLANKINEIRLQQGQDANCIINQYKTGLFNGLELAVSILENRKPRLQGLAGARSIDDIDTPDRRKITKADYLKILMLLSNLETLHRLNREEIHGHMCDELAECIELLTNKVLG